MVDGQAKVPIKEESKPSDVDKKILKLKYDIRGHFDAIRGLHYVEPMHLMASVAEDSQIKLWNLKNIQKDFETNNGYIEPFFSLRGHKGQVYTLTGAVQHVSEETEGVKNANKLLFTAGSEGLIKVWHIPEFPKDTDKYPQTGGRNYQVG